MDPFAPGLLQRLPSSPEKVVLVRASRIGDFICATPAFRALRESLPGAEIALVALPIVEDLARRLSSLDRFVPFPGYPGIAEQFFDARRTRAFLARMQREHFDLAIQMHGTGVFSNPFTRLLGARVTAGMTRAADDAAGLDAAFPVPEHLHEVDRLAAFAVFLGADVRTTALELSLMAADEREARECLASAVPPLVGVHPGAREATKRWPPDHFAAAASRLLRRGGTLVILGGPDEVAAAAQIEQVVRGRCLNLAGRLTLPVVAAVVGRLSVLLSNDSASAHMAYALGTPSVTVFGGTEPRRWGPPARGGHATVARSAACRPCQGDRCPHAFGCLTEIKADEVAAKAEVVLASAGC